MSQKRNARLRSEAGIRWWGLSMRGMEGKDGLRGPLWNFFVMVG